MDKDKTKFIRGVEGRGEEVLQFLKDMGGTNEPVKAFVEAGINKYNVLLWVCDKEICAAEDNSVVGKLLLENCEEVFLKPEFKFKVGDKVMLKENDRILKVTLNGNDRILKIVGSKNVKGEPMYFLGNNKYLYKEEDLILCGDIQTWDDLVGKPINGFFVSDTSRILDFQRDEAQNYDRIVASNEKVAKSMLAMAQISQLMPYYGGEITDEEWLEPSIYKYTLFRYRKEIVGDCNSGNYSFLAFHTEEQRDLFLANNEQLVNDYLMLD